MSQVLRDLDAELGPEAAGKASVDLARRPISAASAGAGFFRQIPLKWVLIALGTLALASILYAIKATRRDQPRDPMQQLSSGLYRSQTKPSAGVAPLSSNLPTSRTPEKERDRRPSR